MHPHRRGHPRQRDLGPELLIRPAPTPVTGSGDGRSPAQKRKGCLRWFAWSAGAILLAAGVGYFWFNGWGTRTHTEGQATRLQYFGSPVLVAVHIDGPPRVLVIRNITADNLEQMNQWLNPDHAEIESISVAADSIYRRYSNWLENRDVLQMGVHGRTKPPYRHLSDGGLAMGIGTEDFVPGSFALMSEREFQALDLGSPILNREVWGRVTYGTYRRTYQYEKPTGYSGP